MIKEHFKYYRGETEPPEAFKGDECAKFWHGEMMFEHTGQSIEFWEEAAKGLLLKLKRTDAEKFKSASRYTIQQFAVILYIEELFMKLPVSAALIVGLFLA